MSIEPAFVGSGSTGPRDAARPTTPGAGLAILVNANAKRGGRRIAAQLGRILPGARVRLTRTTEEVEAWLQTLRDPRCILAAGGDGTAIALVNALNRITPANQAFPPIGVLPLGTGNAWARSTGARKLDQSVRVLASLPNGFPTRRFGIVEVEGTLTSFAGCGWDAEAINEFRKQVEASKGPSKRLAKSIYGYLAATLFRTAPKSMINGRAHLLIENMGDEVYTITADGKLLKINGVKHGSILYEGLSSIAGASTVPEFGYGFRAFPFAERLLGFMNVRVFDRSALSAMTEIPSLWRGVHPVRGMHDWFATAVRMTFSRPMALQIGGDAVGERQTVDFKIGARQVEMLDWRSL